LRVKHYHQRSASLQNSRDEIAFLDEIAVHADALRSLSALTRGFLLVLASIKFRRGSEKIENRFLTVAAHYRRRVSKRILAFSTSG
jgi:hypothetical protein